MRDELAAILLKVVGDQPVVAGPDEILEEPPRLPRDLAQRRALGRVERLTRVRQRPAGRVRDHRRDAPEHDHRKRQRQPRPARRRDQHARCAIAIAGAAHIWRGDLRGDGSTRADLIGRHPFEQAAAA